MEVHNQEIQEAVSYTSSEHLPILYQYENGRISCEEKKELLKKIFSKISHNDEKRKSSLNGLNKFLKTLKSIKSSGSCKSLLHTAGENLRNRQRNGAAIRVQPASIARHSTHFAKSSKHLPVGQLLSIGFSWTHTCTC